eukprot:5925351-Prymnesium_polylepis.2
MPPAHTVHRCRHLLSGLDLEASLQVSRPPANRCRRSHDHNRASIRRGAHSRALNWTRCPAGCTRLASQSGHHKGC